MFHSKSVSLIKFASCFATAVDLIDPRLANHHLRVATIARKIAEELQLSGERISNLVIAGLLHDCGAISLNDRLRAMDFETEDLDGFLIKHTEAGYTLLSTFAPFSDVAKLVRFHHQPWLSGDDGSSDRHDIPLDAHILHLADRIDSSINRDINILKQKDMITNRIKAGTPNLFHPDFVDAFCAISANEAFWLDLAHQTAHNDSLSNLVTTEIRLNDKSLLQFSQLLGYIIDFRCSFTATHSSGVAAVAGHLSKLCGLCYGNCTRLEVAGYLHDLGKLSVPANILEKPTALTADEFLEVKAHPYHTHRVLHGLDELEMINLWASLHHERMDGTGYPFGLKGEELPMGSRLLAVADVYVALTEDRPYREGLPPDRCIVILDQMVADGALDGHMVDILKSNSDEIETVWRESQQRAQNLYQDFNRQLIHPANR